MPEDGCKIAAFPSIARTELTDIRSLIDTLAFLVPACEKCSDRQPVHELDDVKVKDNFRFIFIIYNGYGIWCEPAGTNFHSDMYLRVSTQWNSDWTFSSNGISFPPNKLDCPDDF